MDGTTLDTVFAGRIRSSVPLAPYTTFKIGGPAKYFLEIRSKDELATAVSLCRSAGMPFIILGGGSNILVGDGGFGGVVLRNLATKISVRGIRGSIGTEGARRTVYVEAESGTPMNQLVRVTCDEGLSGLEMHLGLPGSVGGAVAMNSKWTRPRGYVGDCVHQAEILTAAGERKIVPASYFEFAYGRSNAPKNNDVILAVTFMLEPKTKEEVWKTAEESLAYRRSSQPQGVKTAGCAFKNISPAEAVTAATPNGTTSAGFLIDHAGLKGASVGGAAVSPVHANFIVNTGQATARDVVELMDLIKRKVSDTFHVTLREEVLKVGEF